MPETGRSRLFRRPRAAPSAATVGIASVAVLVLAAVLPGGVDAVDQSVILPTSIRHVVTIVFENAEALAVMKEGSYFAYLAQKYAFASSVYSICHPSAPNYVALTSGATFAQCGTDTPTQYDATNIADLVEGAGESWAGFDESMPSPCDLTDSYPYVAKHNPMLFYQDIAGNAGRCAQHVLSLTDFSLLANASAIPNYSFITPNMLDDGHDTNVTYASEWLQDFLAPLVNSTLFADTAFLIVFDEGTSNLGAGTSAAGPTNTTGGGHIYLAIVSPLSVGMGDVTLEASQYSVLTTTEWLLGLGSTGHLDSNSVWPPLTGAFNT